VSYVSSRRNIPESTIRDQLGAMEYDSKSAKDLKLVDAIGSRQDAYSALAGAGKHRDDYRIVQPTASTPSLSSSIWAAITRRPQPKAQTPVKPADLCSLSQSQTALAYHGDISQWCAKD
jgi:ClpP class serine protease